MDDKHKIDQMKREGRITPDQAELLLRAINESEQRKREILKDTRAQTKYRNSKITALAEQYPQLKTSSNYLAVQDQLAETENQIAQARQIYNQKVKKYNSGLRTFPFNLLAVAFGFGAKTYSGAAE